MRDELATMRETMEVYREDRTEQQRKIEDLARLNDKLRLLSDKWEREALASEEKYKKSALEVKHMQENVEASTSKMEEMEKEVRLWGEVCSSYH